MIFLPNPTFQFPELFFHLPGGGTWNVENDNILYQGVLRKMF